MILVTVGSQAPFDRLIRAVDEWTASRQRSDVFAQIASGSYTPNHMEFVRMLEPMEFKRRLKQARVVVAHAGMGSVITALEFGKPIVVMPRRGHLNETRNDHQVLAAKEFGLQGRVIVAKDESELAERIDCAVNFGLSPLKRIEPVASPELISTIRSFIEKDVVLRRVVISATAVNHG